MNSLTNKTRLAEKQKTKKATELQKKKQYEINKRRTLIRKQNESNKELKHNERRQKRKNLIDEDIDLCKFFELATRYKIYVNSINLHEIQSEILQHYTDDFELNGLMLLDLLKIKQMSDLKMWMISKVI